MTPNERNNEGQPDRPLIAGTQIGLYRIETQAGRRRHGYRVSRVDTKLNRPVAIKFLSSEVADVNARRRFQREAQMASSLNHPHILTVHDAASSRARVSGYRVRGLRHAQGLGTRETHVAAGGRAADGRG